MAGEAIECACNLMGTLSSNQCYFYCDNSAVGPWHQSFVYGTVKYVGLWESLGRQYYGYMRRAHYCFWNYINLLFVFLTFVLAERPADRL